MSDPMEPVQKLMEAFGKEIESLGLHLHTFALLPNPDGPPHMVQAMLTFDGSDLDAIGTGTPDSDAALSTDEKEVFDMLERDFMRSTEDDAAAKAAESLRKMQEDLENGKGVLGDD